MAQSIDSFVRASGSYLLHTSDTILLASLTAMLGSHAQYDRAKVAAGQLSSKVYFSGESSGFRIAKMMGESIYRPGGADTHVQTTDTRNEDTQTSPHEIKLLKARMADTIRDLAEKRSALTFKDLKRLLFRCAAAIISLEDKVCYTQFSNSAQMLTVSISLTEASATTSLLCRLRHSVLHQSPQESKLGHGSFPRNLIMRLFLCLS